jgi:putative photosynthetic complex assembly protein 2
MNGPSPWLPICTTIFAWWFSTGLILLLVRTPRARHTLFLTLFGAVALIAFWGLFASKQSQTSIDVYYGFFCALLIWGWHEASFLMGKITGPRPAPCPAGAVGWSRFRYATATLIYHEVALFVTLIIIGVILLSAPNQIGFWTFALLFAMRLSSKLNIFLGVPNLTEEFFPDHLEHLKSYLPKRPMNALMPFSIISCLLVLGWLWQQLATTTNQGDQATAIIILLTLTGLGLLEHIFMITPLPDAALWRWAAPLRRPQSPAINSNVVTDEPKSHKNG